MITPFEVYLVMQLDSIFSALSFLATAGFIVAAVLTIWNGASRFDAAEYPSLCDRPEREKLWAARASSRKQVLVWTVPIFLLAALIPSSKTAAAMIILPALTSKEVTEPLAAEGRELYALAKQALRDAVDAKDPPKEEAK